MATNSPPKKPKNYIHTTYTEKTKCPSTDIFLKISSTLYPTDVQIHQKPRIDL